MSNQNSAKARGDHQGVMKFTPRKNITESSATMPAPSRRHGRGSASRVLAGSEALRPRCRSCSTYPKAQIKPQPLTSPETTH